MGATPKSSPPCFFLTGIASSPAAPSSVSIRKFWPLVEFENAIGHQDAAAGDPC